MALPLGGDNAVAVATHKAQGVGADSGVEDHLAAVGDVGHNVVARNGVATRGNGIVMLLVVGENNVAFLGHGSRGFVGLVELRWGLVLLAQAEAEIPDLNPLVGAALPERLLEVGNGCCAISNAEEHILFVVEVVVG